jgi:hypothetical protein
MLFAQGCGPAKPTMVRVYTGSPLLPEQIATAQVMWRAQVKDVDGREISLEPSQPYFLELLPGEHTFNLFCRIPSKSPRVLYFRSLEELTLKATLFAGKKYIL